MNKKAIIILLFSALMFHSCSVIDQIAQTQALKQCTFDIKGLDKINLAGIELRQGMKRSDLTAPQVIQLTGAFFNNELPLTFNVLLNIDNPNDRQAMMSRMDYSVILDGREMLSGRLDDSFSIPAKGNTVVPVTVQADLLKLFSGQQADALANLAFRLTGNQGTHPVELQVKIKPYIEVGLRQVAYPGFMTLKKTF
ncbi:MAG: LEA type 2 family protein [Bacteroidetes bacterium]|nr:LEA type 2 family protein [Bacteroidota bacterium]